MSVIGRLDRQVEDVLITPLSKTRPATPEVPPAEPTRNDETQMTTNDDAHARQTSGERAELPVWLL